MLDIYFIDQYGHKMLLIIIDKCTNLVLYINQNIFVLNEKKLRK